MTLQQVKEQVAYDSDYPDWNALVNEMAGDTEVMEFYLDIIARQYAGYVTVSTLKYASENATVCSSEFDGIYVNIDSILNTPVQLP